eukprot:CAMPEP_0114487676 /NCGR_PEP_ID=MMETSP0109-20121206/904_1 /TAXON_ID=29199 /ORGANISM="Chlorarachnion reptans, Strain CCCM449" /LENGTH=326 /DNA_ID=CAMNT_0001663979 /DNA_START=238 /DNA_END=1218 /DNA_ORIENTATION=-
MSREEEKVEEMLRSIYNRMPEISNRYPEDRDIKAAEKAGTRLTYGEIHPKGVLKIMDEEHLDAERAKVLVDIGSGRGKLALQCFHQFNLSRVIGVEISRERYNICKLATEEYVQHCRRQGIRISCEENPGGFEGIIVKRLCPGDQKENAERKDSQCSPKVRTLEIYNVDVGMLKDVLVKASVDIVVMDVAFSSPMPESFVEILKCFKSGTKIISYENLKSAWPVEKSFPYRQYARGDRYMTSWKRGHEFYSWRRKPRKRKRRTRKFIQDGNKAKKSLEVSGAAHQTPKLHYLAHREEDENSSKSSTYSDSENANICSTSTDAPSAE